MTTNCENGHDGDLGFLYDVRKPKIIAASLMYNLLYFTHTKFCDYFHFCYVYNTLD